jgi:hypothetical protein
MNFGESASESIQSLPSSIARAFSYLYIAFFMAWATFMLIPFGGRMAINRGNWSNFLAPTLLFLALVVSARWAGFSLGRDTEAAKRVRPIAVLRSALIVSASIAGTLFVILALGSALHKLPGGVVFFAPTLVFLESLLFSFFIHWSIAVMVFKKSSRHA